ncbi:MAG: 50S ribosomal protein L18e [Candidatus Nanoarchaeia archaeon]
MTKSKTLIGKQLQRKKNQSLVEAIISAKKKTNWLKIAEILSRPRRKSININLNQIEKDSKHGEVIVIPGKVLSQGEINKKVKIVALKFSEKTKEKLNKARIEFSTINEEIKKNPEGKGIKILLIDKKNG